MVLLPALVSFGIHLSRRPRPEPELTNFFRCIGKVKSQTPKVEAQEKKKTPKGRAHKRELYTRRFVNVTLAPGGKRKVCRSCVSRAKCGTLTKIITDEPEPNRIDNVFDH
jgi:small subunit ribosomal protein S30e